MERQENTGEPLSRRRFIAVCAALVGTVAAGSLGSWHLRQEVASGVSASVAYPSAGQLSNFAFMRDAFSARKAKGEHPYLVFGSSELNPRHGGWPHPARLLSGGAYDVDTMMVGRAGATSIWHAVEMGALATTLGVRRIAFFVSMQWFMCYRDPRKSLPALFSEGAYRAFSDSHEFSDELKRRVTKRMAVYGVDCRGGGSPLGALVSNVDDAAKAYTDGLRVDLKLIGKAKLADEQPPELVRGDADHPLLADGSPDWDAILARANKLAAERSAGNADGYDDAWYRAKYARWIQGAQEQWSVPASGAYFSKRELEEFKMALQVCQEAGVDPLVVLQPAKGIAYDQTIYTREVRSSYYELIRSTCAEHGVEVADFSGREYDPTFFFDYSHPSAEGAARYSRALYTFFKNGHPQV